MRDDESSSAEPVGSAGDFPAGDALPALPDFGGGDYVRLPELGCGFYSLEDAALLSALDMWSEGRAPGVPAEGLPDKDDPDKFCDNPDDQVIRTALEPLRAQLLAALIRSAESAQLKVEVKGRTLADSRLIPARTFVHLSDLVEWLAVYGHERGEIIADAEESDGAFPWLVAGGIAVKRASLRLGHRRSYYSGGPPVGSDDNLRALLQQRWLQLAHLEQQLDEARRCSSRDDRPIRTRERRTLLVVIAALCKRAGIDPTARGAAAEVASATAELGVPISDDTIRALLRAIPDALG